MCLLAIHYNIYGGPDKNDVMTGGNLLLSKAYTMWDIQNRKVGFATNTLIQTDIQNEDLLFLTL